MFDYLKAAVKEMDTALAELDPKSMIGTQPAVCLEVLSSHERSVAATRLRLTARASEMHHWQRQGFRSFEDWYAATFGTTCGQARRKTRTAKNLDNGRHSTADALADGEISEDEADVIADAADKNPHAEQELLDTARNKGRNHDDLKKQAADAKAAGEDDRDRADRLRRGRRAGWGVDREGFWTLSGRFEPHVGAEMKAHLAAETERVFAAARAAGNREGHDRYRADAVANLIRGRTPSPEARPEAADPTPRPDSDATSTNRGGSRPAGTGEQPPNPRAGHSCQRPATTSHRNPSAEDRPNGTPADGAQLDLELDPHREAAPRTSPAAAADQHGTRSPASFLDRTSLDGTGVAENGPADEPAQREVPGRTQVHKELIVDINLETLRRGRVLSGETCQIRGVGPIPVEVARQWADDAFVKAVIRDGTDIKTVVHYGRNLRAEVRTALGVRDQHICSVPGCSNPRIEYDHDHPHAEHGPTSTTNLRALCVPHHRQRTHHGYELEGEPGDRCWTDPEGNVLFADDPAQLTGPAGLVDDPTEQTATHPVENPEHPTAIGPVNDPADLTGTADPDRPRMPVAARTP